ncbi:MAG: radical SAM family heme chaperone HemW [Gemmataceae bacterium]
MLVPANAIDLPPWSWPRAAYVHVPFCAHHCGYCDFAIAARQDHLIELYLDALAAELATLGQPQPVRTLFLGGGTPTHLSAAQLERLLSTVLDWLPLEVSEGAEFSVECNPDTLTADKIDVLADRGVNRVSLGAQSFHAELLAVLERAHDAEEIPRAVERVRRRIDNVSLDLIFGIPGQSQWQWRTDLVRALDLAPDHVSTYGLTYEKGTPLWKRRQGGQVRPLDEDAELTLYAQAIDTLEAAGFEHYEISNFARPGRRCRHNQVYWANESYFGYGMGAARYVLGRRELNTRDLHGYIRRALCGESVTWQSEELETEERARETMAVQLRRAEGIDRIAFATQTGCDLQAVASAALARHVEQGFLSDDGHRVHLTRRGKYVADAIIENLMSR